jgi:hypothetical protein
MSAISKRLHELYFVACQAYTKTADRPVRKEQFAAFAEAWMRTFTRLTGDPGANVLFFDSVRNAYRPELRTLGASNIDDIIAGLRLEPSFLPDQFPDLPC